MKIKIAQTAGFCMGVRRAVDLAVDHASQGDKPVVTLGPLIHNNQTIEMLRERGVKTITDTDPEPGSAKVLIRAHGIPPELQRQCSDKGHIIIDGTCPKVKTVHKVIQKHRAMGFEIIVAGDEGHAEVVGLMGYAGTAGHLIQCVEDVKRLPHMPKICFVSQTTFDRETFDEIAEAIRIRFCDSEVLIKKTICSATDKRQEETLEMAKKVDAMIVVGGKNSANTLRLAKISLACGTPTQHVETPEEIDWDVIARLDTVGVTAGASTPNWMIKRVVEHIQHLSETKRHSVKNIGWQVFNACVNLNIFVATGAVALYYLSCSVQGFPFTWHGALICFLYFLSMHLWNSLVNVDQIRHLELNRYQFYRAHRFAVWSLAITCITFLLLISFSISLPIFYFMLFLTAAGSIYHFTIVPPPFQRFLHSRTLKDIPTSRDLFVALAWAVLITFMPHALRGSVRIGVVEIFVFLWVFLLAFLRSVMFDLRDIEGDRIMGRETLVILVGERKARFFIQLTLGIAFTCLIVFTAFEVVPLHSWHDSRTMALMLQMPALAYSLTFMRNSHRIPINHSALFSFLADVQFFLAGLGAWLAVMAFLR